MSRVRAATTADWPSIWPCWREIVAEGETYAYPDGISSEQACALWLEEPPGLTVVFDDGGTVLGSAKMGPNRPGRGDHIGTASFMVSRAARGRGVGRALAEWTIDWHRREGYRGIQFNAVVATNTAALRLWEDLGFRTVGVVPNAFRSRTHGLVGLHVMFLDLTDGVSDRG